MTTDEISPELETAINRGLDNRDRANMAPTIDYFHALLAENPGNAAVLLEVAGSYDTAGDEQTAERYYRQAFDAGLTGDNRRRALLQFGSTLRNLGRFDESLSVFVDARAQFPESASLRVFHALSLHAAGKGSSALAELLTLIADTDGSTDIERYIPAIHGNAEYLAGLDK